MDRYRAVLTGAPATRPAWVGLGLALEASGEGETATSLLHRPELVRALALEERARGARTPDPLELARWTARIPGLITQPATGVPQL